MSRASTILRNDDVKIAGKVSLKISGDGRFSNLSERLVEEKDQIEKKILEAKEEYKKIVIEMNRQSEIIIEEANERSKEIEKKAYTIGYEQGLKNGYEDGYKESYEQNINKAIEESEVIKAEGYKTLLNIKKNTAEYMKANQEKIIEISVAIAEQVLREKFEDVTSMNKILEKVIREYRLKNDLVIKVNGIYVEELQKNVTNMINSRDLNQRIFVIEDTSIDKGNAEIETESGKLIVGVNIVLDKIKSELL